MTVEYFDGYEDAVRATLARIDAGYSYEEIADYLENAYAGIARARGEAGFSHRVFKVGE